MQNSWPLPRGLNLRALVLLGGALTVSGPMAAQETTVAVPLDPPKSLSDYRSNNNIADAPAGQVPVTLIFFPPFPPPLDESVDRLMRSSAGGATPPFELADFAGEIFYAPLSTLLLKGELTEKLRRRLADYRATREDLQTELQLELARARTTDATSRLSTLEVLARKQAPRLSALEETAENLRQDLVDDFYSWFGHREWQLGDHSARGDSPDEVAGVMRAFAAYRKGLNPAQRGLLREISLEAGLAREDAAAATAAQPYVFFSPETARVQWPAEIPAPLAARMAEHQSKKSTLKKELYDAVYEQEQASFIRGNTIKTLAAAQVGRLTELETLAEEIRRGLALLPSSARARASSPLPPVLTGRVAALVRQRNALQTTAEAAIEAIKRPLQAAGAPIVLAYAFEPGALSFTVKPAGNVRRAVPKEVRLQVEQTTRAMAVVADTYGRESAATANDLIALRDDVGRALVGANAKAVSTALVETMRYAALQESAGAYLDYRTAVFEPGLAPAQRRLLLAHAIGELHLPLPPGELQPTGRKS